MELSLKQDKTEGFKKSDIRKMLNNDTPFAIKEAYNSVRTNLMFTNKGEACPIYVVTSAMPNDGKTINCINVAISFAQMGKRTLIIDADMRNPTVHHIFGMSLQDGLSEILAGMVTNVNIKPTELDCLSVLSAGKIPPNPAELLSGEKLEILLKFVRNRFDYIFIDTPPVEVVTDASVLAKKVTGFLLVVRNGVTDLSVIKHSVSTLEQVDASVVGFLLNDINPKNQRYYKNYNNKHRYYYDYSYSSKGKR